MSKLRLRSKLAYLVLVVSIFGIVWITTLFSFIDTNATTTVTFATKATRGRLVSESRWSRHYEEDWEILQESRFLDGTATITLDELERGWQRWPAEEKLDFCNAFSAIHGRVPDGQNILRFLVKNGDDDTWSSIAMSVAYTLPREESVPIIREWCRSCKVGRGSNYYQALALTGSPEALGTLRASFARIWNTKGLMDGDDFVNWIAYDAICCMEYMLELGEEPVRLREEYNSLWRHSCKEIRSDARQLDGYF